jgi:hypothetical protein
MKRKTKTETTVFDLVYNLLEQHVDAKPHQLVGIALWALHTHVHRKFDTSPRLAILSPIESSGKSTVLKILKGIVLQPEYIIDPRSTIYHLVEQGYSLLIDEVDNARLDKDLKAVLNQGHIRDGKVPRKIDGEMRLFPVYGPIALAGIGTLPPPLLSRCVIVHIHRSYSKVRYSNPEAAAAIGIKVEEWAAQVTLNLDPHMPPSVSKGRGADNWRVLIAVADSLGCGDIARNAALKFAGEDIPTNKRIELLHDVRIVFNETQYEVIPNYILLLKLTKLEDGLGDWTRLTKTMLGHMLNEFQITNKPMRWSVSQQLARCYTRADFEHMWQNYLKPLPTPPVLKVVRNKKKEN